MLAGGPGSPPAAAPQAYMCPGFARLPGTRRSLAVCTGKGHYAGRVMTQPGGSGAGRTGRGPRGAAGGAGGRPAPRRSGWSNNPANYHRFSFHAIKDFMSEENESVLGHQTSGAL